MKRYLRALVQCGTFVALIWSSSPAQAQFNVKGFLDICAAGEPSCDTMVIGFIEGYRAAQSEMSDGKPWLCLPKGIGGQAIIDAVIEDLRSPGQKQDVHAGKALHGALVRAFPCPY